MTSCRPGPRIPTGTGSSGQPNTPFLNENAQSLAFTGTYQLAMANAGVNTSLSNASQGVNTDDTQFFVTTTGSPNVGLGYGYTIFGQLLSGQATLTKMTQVPRVYNSVYGETSLPANPIIMSSLSLSATNPSGVALIDTTQARPGDTATFQVTATDPTDGSTVTRSFTVTAGTYAGPTDPAIDFKPLADPVSATVAEGSSTNVALVGHDGYPDTNYPGTLSYSLVSQPSHGTISQFNATTGTFVYTPQAGYSGPDSIQYAVKENGPPPPIGQSQTTGQWLFGPAVTTTSAPATVALTVTPTAPATTPTITWSNPADITYGTALVEYAARCAGFRARDLHLLAGPWHRAQGRRGADALGHLHSDRHRRLHRHLRHGLHQRQQGHADDHLGQAGGHHRRHGPGPGAARRDGVGAGDVFLHAGGRDGPESRRGPGARGPLHAHRSRRLHHRLRPRHHRCRRDNADAGTHRHADAARPRDRRRSTTSNKNQVTAVSLTFDGSIDPSAASSPATYQLIKQGKHGLFIAKGKAKIKIKSVSYDPSNHTVTLIPRKPFALSKPVEVLIGGKPAGTL